MKTCNYCGRENADDATQCHECGMQEFQGVAVQEAATTMPKTKGRHTVFRIVIASGVGLAVTSLSLYVAWQNAADAPSARFQQFATQRSLSGIEQAITDYQQKFGALPRSWDQLRNTTNFSSFSEENGDFLDGWHRPFHFSFSGTSCLVISYGRDGKPGGTGLDRDLTNKDWKPKEARPTFLQFLFDMPTRAMIHSCLVCGGLAFLLSVFTVQKPDETSAGLAALGLKVAATTIGAVIIAVIISALHIPSGH